MANKTISGNAEITDIRLAEQIADPANEANYWHLYVKAGGVYAISPAGTVVGPFTASGSAYTEGARAYHDANQSISHNSATVLALNSERFDTDGIHDNVVNNSRLTCQTAGKYQIIGQVNWTIASGGRRSARILLNGATYIAIVEPSSVADATGAPNQEVSTIYDLSVGDYVELEVYHNQGAPLNINSVGNFSPEFMMQRIG